MTSLEILSAAITGQAAPRIPIFCNLLDQGARELNMSPEEYYSRGEYVADAQLKMLRRYGHDNVWSLSYVGKEAKLLGCQDILFAKNGVPNVADFVIKSWDDIATFEIPKDITQHPEWQSIADCLAQLGSEVGATHPICAYITASTTLPVLLMGMDKWMELVLTGPTDLRDELVRKCSDFLQQQISALRAAGANVIVYATPFGSPYFISKKMIASWSMPWMQRDLAAGVDNVVYYCGMAPFKDVLELVFEKLGTAVYYLGPTDDLAECKGIINTRGLTCGVIDDIQMINWTPEQTREQVKRIIEIGKPGGHFLFGTGLMPLSIPEENIRSMLDAAFEYGSYT
ncbi:MAG: uroporphyrinogen decarboxylase [Methyloprofundus sp.]|nr:MAG: uroporphyrinogen decarboxylase [Methyloprofundus sp.]